MFTTIASKPQMVTQETLHLSVVKSGAAGINQLCYRFSAALTGFLAHLQMVAGAVKLRTITIHNDPGFLSILQARERLALFSELPSSHLRINCSSHLEILCIFMANRVLMKV